MKGYKLMSQEIECPSCRGEGVKICKKCEGEGTEPCPCPECGGEPSEVGGTGCKTCGGDGYTEKDCSVCKGSGKEPDPENKQHNITCETCKGSGEIIQ